MKSWAAVSRKTSTSIKLREVQDRNGFQGNGRLKRQSERAVSSNAVLGLSLSLFLTLKWKEIFSVFVQIER